MATRKTRTTKSKTGLDAAVCVLARENEENLILYNDPPPETVKDFILAYHERNEPRVISAAYYKSYWEYESGDLKTPATELDISDIL